LKSKLPKLNQAIIIGALISVVGITTACNTVDDVYSNDQKPLEKTIVHEDEKKSPTNLIKKQYRMMHQIFSYK
jgi:hypothetical protein